MKVRFGWAVAMLSVLVFAAACQPKDTRPGLWLRGERAEPLRQDWRFTDEVEEIFIETRTWYGFRHATTIWCVEQGGRLYVGSYDDEVKFWERNLERNPQARLQIGGRLYDVTVTPVADAELDRELDERYAAKYDMAEVFGDDLPPWRYYSVTLEGRDDDRRRE